MNAKGIDVRTCDTDNKDDVSAILSTQSIVHFCIPRTGFKIKHIVQEGQIIILHDSVMATSQLINERFFGGKAVHVHMLMNETNTVVIDKSAVRNNILMTHLKTISDTLRFLSIHDHDRIMARSQAPFALLLKTVGNDLVLWEGQGLLTSSASLLRQSLKTRETAWTTQTLDTLVHNKEILVLLDEMKQTVLSRGQEEVL